MDHLKLVFLFLISLFPLEGKSPSSDRLKEVHIYCHGPFLCGMAQNLITPEYGRIVHFKEGRIGVRLPKNVLDYDIILLNNYDYDEEVMVSIKDLFYKKADAVFLVGSNPIASLIYQRPTENPEEMFSKLNLNKQRDYNPFFFFPLAIISTYESLGGFLTRFFDVKAKKIAGSFFNQERLYKKEEKMAKVCNQNKVIFSFRHYGLINFFHHLGIKSQIEGPEPLPQFKDFKRKVHIYGPAFWYTVLAKPYPVGSEVWDLSSLPIDERITPGEYLENLFTEGIKICSSQSKSL